MYKDKLNLLSLTWVYLIQFSIRKIWTTTNSIVLSLTWVWLKFNIQLKTTAGSHVQRQTQTVEFGLSLTQIQFSP